MSTRDKLIVFVAQGFGIGRIPFAPGTWGSVLGLVWAFLLLHRATDSTIGLFALATVLQIPVSAWLCGNAEKIMGEKDPPSVVIDEIIALPLCFLHVGLHDFFGWRGMCQSDPCIELGIPEHLIGLGIIGMHFALFRLFDIWKPWPVHQSQNLPGGWGVVMDDVLAAVYVNLVVLAIYTVAYFVR